MRRIVALAVLGDWKGEWQVPAGNERAFVAHPVGAADEVRLEVEMLKDGLVQSSVLSLSSGPTVVDTQGWLRYRIAKSGSSKVATTVEVILGSASGKGRNAANR